MNSNIVILACVAKVTQQLVITDSSPFLHGPTCQHHQLEGGSKISLLTRELNAVDACPQRGGHQNSPHQTVAREQDSEDIVGSKKAFRDGIYCGGWQLGEFDAFST